MAAWRMSTATVWSRAGALAPDLGRGQPGGGDRGLRGGADAKGGRQRGIGAGELYALKRRRIAAGDDQGRQDVRGRCAIGWRQSSAAA